MTIGSELDKQIYPEGESTWGCKSGWVDVTDLKVCLGDVELKLLKKFKMASVPIMEIIKGGFGESLLR